MTKGEGSGPFAAVIGADSVPVVAAVVVIPVTVLVGEAAAGILPDGKSPTGVCVGVGVGVGVGKSTTAAGVGVTVGRKLGASASVRVAVAVTACIGATADAIVLVAERVTITTAGGAGVGVSTTEGATVMLDVIVAVGDKRSVVVAVALVVMSTVAVTGGVGWLVCGPKRGDWEVIGGGVSSKVDRAAVEVARCARRRMASRSSTRVLSIGRDNIMLSVA